MPFVRFATIILVFLLVGPLVCGSSSVYGQDLNARVEILSPQVQNTNKRVLDLLQKVMRDFLNNRSWSQRIVQPQERIDCSFVITITSWDGSSSFKAQAQIASTRPVFQSGYQSPMLNRMDTQFDFTYVEGQSLDFSDQQFSNNLTSLLAYYAYLIVGIDADTFAPNGGTTAFQAAQAVVNQSQYAGFEGWGSMDGTQNRYWIVQNLLDTRYQPIRAFWYAFSREGLDRMHDQPTQARVQMKELLSLLNQIDRQAQGAILDQLFFTAKVHEFVGIFGSLAIQDRMAISQLLIQMDPANATHYETLKKAR
jgi:hypothetical protein